ncbi:MAG: glycosyltransferase [Vampirovibrionales bacterium]|nr:glycosyltransferase [Vampirovibrionales bacterium]
MSRVAFLLNNDFGFDARVKREIDTLLANGVEVTLFCVCSAGGSLPAYEQNGRLTIRRLFKKPLKTFEPFTFRHLKGLTRILLASQGRFDVVHAHDSNTLLLGWLLARLWRAKLVYDSHELWGSVFAYEREIALKAFEAGAFSKKCLSRKLAGLKQSEHLETWLLARCDALISVNDTLCRLLREKSSRKIPHVVSIRNIPHYFEMHTQPTRRFHEAFSLPEETKILLYQGDIKTSRGVDLLLDAVARMSYPDFALILMGPIPEKEYARNLKQRLGALKQLGKAVFHQAQVPQKELLYWTASADLGLAPIINVRESYYYCLPNKLFEYVQAGIPVATSDFPEMKNVIEAYGLGFTFNPEQPEVLAQALDNFLNDPQRGARYRQNVHQAKEALTWDNEEKKLLVLYQILLNSMSDP